MNRTVPGLDPDGFTSIADLRKLAQKPELFLRSMVVPALVIDIAPGTPAAGAGDPAVAAQDDTTRERSYKRTILSDDTKNARPTESARYIGRVAFLTKRPGNPFPDMISVGRASNNDLVFALSSVSKLHGYFLRDGERWSYSDHRSTNGTTVNGQRIEPGQRWPLEDGDKIGVGSDLRVQFLSPAKLLERSRV